MATTARTITPKKVKEFPEYLDFDRLRAEGITHIQELAGKTWTDHNAHDPGITILELLCYALTDLGYRTNLDIRDLLAQPPSVTTSANPPADDNFPTAAHILSCNPLTILDLRKLLVDTAGVRNAWLTVVDETNTNNVEPNLTIDSKTGQLKIAEPRVEPRISINGLYNVLLELDDAYLTQQAVNGNDATGAILADVHQKLHAHRNLCEDYLTIRVLRDEAISLCGEIELATSANPDDVMLTILDEIQEFLSPTISFYTLNQRLKMGATPDQIFEGRPLNLDNSFGFVDTTQLKSAERRAVIHVSDIYRVLLGIDGVTAVKNLRLVNLTNGTNLEGEEWILPLTPDTFRPILDSLKSINSLTLSKRNVVYGVNVDYVLSVFARKLANRLKVLKKPEELDLPITLGTYRGDQIDDPNSSNDAGLGEHFSIQNDLPAAYGTSGVSFPALNNTPAERERQAQALQLKGYLLFFDQLLANYLTQLGNVRGLFSTNVDPTTDGVLAVGNLDDVAFVDKLLPFSATPGSLTAVNQYFSEGDRIAKVIDPVTRRRLIFSTPTERDAALAQIIKAFDEDSFTRTYPPGENQSVHFQITSHGIHPVNLLSSKTYKDAADADAAIGLVRFLATLETSYVRRLQRPAEDHRYTFDWIFHWPDTIPQTIQQMVENPTDYFRRKSNLFDHLLARFAEDFTDYTLLLFGLNKNTNQQPGNETVVRDKAAFINAYPDISRNRSRGLNQLLPPIDYWQGNNVSGIENRLATMLGFKRRATTYPKQLNFFEIVADDRKQFLFQDRRGITLLQSPQPSRVGTLADFQKAIQELAPLSASFEPIDCATEPVYGFRLIDRDGCVVALHPNTYGLPEARDAMLHYTWLVARDADRLPIDFVAKNKGFYANVLKADGTPLFRAVAATSTVEEAKQVALAIRRAAADANHYRKLPGNTQGFGFQLRSRSKTDKTSDSERVLATHPKRYSTADERNDVIDQTIPVFAENPLRVLIQNVAPRYYWAVQLLNGGHLTSLHQFKTDDQTRAAANRAMALVKTVSNLAVHLLDDGTYCVQLIEHRTYPSESASDKPLVVLVPLAQTQSVANQQEARQLIDEIHQSANPKSVQIQTKPTQFYGQLANPDTGVWLEDVRFFATADDAELAFDDVLEAACQGFWLNDDTINNGCAHGFSLLDGISGKLLATHPDVYDTAQKRDDVLAEIQDISYRNRIRFEAEEISDSWQFELVLPNSEGGLSAVLREAEGVIHTTQAESQQFFEANVRDTLAHFDDSFIKKVDQPKSFSFQVQNASGQILAEHPDSYPLETDRDEIAQKLTNYLEATNEATNLSENLKKRFTVPDTDEAGSGYVTLITDACPITTENPLPENPVRQRWRVRDANVRLAVYQRTFGAEQDARNVVDQLIEQYHCQPPRYSEIVLGAAATPTDTYWVIRDRNHVMWLSPVTYGSKAETRQAFEDSLMRVMTASMDLNNYRVKSITDSQTRETSFQLELFDESTKPIAVSELFDNPILAQQFIGKRHKYAQLFPFLKTTEGIYFQLYNPQDQRIEWRSTIAYATWQEALDAFMAFTDMLNFESHYELIGDATCGWQITLIEVLLEGANSFVVTSAQAEPFGWEQVEAFLDRYQATDQMRVAYPYIDHTDGCQYRFQLVSDTYALARHPVAFHTQTEREIRRDELFLLYQNSLTAKPLVSVLWEKVITQFPAEAIPALRRSLQNFSKLFVVVEPHPTGTIYLLGAQDETTNARLVIDDESASEDELIEKTRQLQAFLKSTPEVDRGDNTVGFEIRVATGTETHQLAGLAKAHDFPHYEVIWESVKTYTQSNDLANATERCRQLLNEKTNYSRYEAADQSFTLALTDPTEVLATQPRRYDSLTDCREAIKRALQHVDTEGFHIVEHILLRPRRASTTQFLPIQLNEQELEKLAGKTVTVVTNEQDEFETYIPGSDPYSLTATVVLPYWSRRFRSVDFRQFFENTLRRETPVHILLDIVWITPQQMKLFESNLDGWLEVLAQPLSPTFTQRTDALVAVLGQLTNTFPHAILNDCNGAPIILDETTID